MDSITLHALLDSLVDPSNAGDRVTYMSGFVQARWRGWVGEGPTKEAAFEDLKDKLLTAIVREGGK